jgi:hypothetical protein
MSGAVCFSKGPKPSQSRSSWPDVDEQSTGPGRGSDLWLPGTADGKPPLDGADEPTDPTRLRRFLLYVGPAKTSRTNMRATRRAVSRVFGSASVVDHQGAQHLIGAVGYFVLQGVQFDRSDDVGQVVVRPGSATGGGQVFSEEYGNRLAFENQSIPISIKL